MIPLSVPNLEGNEWLYIKDCLDTNWVSSVGSYVDKFERLLAEYTGVELAVATSNGTAAIHISLILAGVEANDLVIISNITFVAPCNAIMYLGASPLLVDADRDTWQLDVGLTEKMLTEECEMRNGSCYHIQTGKRVKAVIPVHVLGNMVDMDALLLLAARFNIIAVEDATESLGSSYKGKAAGSFGLLGCLSFNGNKIMTTGGGGMILTNDLTAGKKAKHLTTQAKSHAVEYFHDQVGYNYRLVNVLAAMGVAQFEQLPGFVLSKQATARYYTHELKDIPGFRPQKITEGVDANCWLYTAGFERAFELHTFLNARGIQTRRFWVPMNQLPAFAGCLYYNSSDHSDAIYSDCISLPCSSNISQIELEFVVSTIRQFYT